MSTPLTATDLRRIMIQAAGVPDALTESQIMGSSFADLDVDSIARIAMVTTIENELGLSLADTEAEQVPSPERLLGLVNAEVSQR